MAGLGRGRGSSSTCNCPPGARKWVAAQVGANGMRANTSPPTLTPQVHLTTSVVPVALMPQHGEEGGHFPVIFTAGPMLGGLGG